MEQDPAYLRNQSRRLHARYRRKRIWNNFGLAAFAIFFGFRFVLSLVDLTAGLGWGSSRVYVLESLGFIAGVAALWLVSSIVQAIMLAYIRHTYGPEPSD
jgi:hypothetical protein